MWPRWPLVFFFLFFPTGNGTFHCNSSEALATCYVQEWCICAPSKRCRIASNSLVLWKIQNQCPCIFADVFFPTHPFSNSFLTKNCWITWRAQTWGKADGDEDCLEDLLTEYTLMRDFSHKNVAKTFEASYPKARECLFGGVFCLRYFSHFHMRWLSVGSKSFDQVFQDSEFFYLVNEPYFGGDLTKIAKRAHDQGLCMSESWWRLLFQQCLEGLEYLHAQAAAQTAVVSLRDGLNWLVATIMGRSWTRFTMHMWDDNYILGPRTCNHFGLVGGTTPGMRLMKNIFSSTVSCFNLMNPNITSDGGATSHRMSKSNPLRPSTGPREKVMHCDIKEENIMVAGFNHFQSCQKFWFSWKWEDWTLNKLCQSFDTSFVGLHRGWFVQEGW